MLNGVKIDFNFSQEFYLKEIDMDSKYLLFETTDVMKNINVETLLDWE